MHRALILVVDSRVSSRHSMWRLLDHRSFGVLEAGDSDAARRWIEERPDIDAIIVDDELVDGRGAELVRELGRERHPIAERAIVVASEWRRVMLSGLNVVERGDVDTMMSMLTRWFAPSLTHARRSHAPAALAG